jgi:hypothetical protein
LTDSNMTDSNETDSNMTDSKVTGSNMTDSNMTDSNMTDSNVTGSNVIFSLQPLLHMCMSQLLEIARSPLDFGVTSEIKSVLVDLPQAQALHFLKILVQDSSLRQDMAQYMSQVTIICFNNFSSLVWTVR